MLALMPEGDEPPNQPTQLRDAEMAPSAAAGRNSGADAHPARRVSDEGSRGKIITSARRRTAQPRAPVFPARHGRHPRLRAPAGRHRGRHRDRGDQQREGSPAAGEQPDQAPPAALQRQADRRQELPGAAPGSARRLAPPRRSVRQDGRRWRATITDHTIRPPRAAKPCAS